MDLVFRGRSATAERCGEGAFWVVTLEGGEGNPVDPALLDDLPRILAAAAGEKRLCAMLFRAAGEDFCRGADPRELAPDRAEPFITSLCALVGEMLDSSLFLIAAIRGRCLGAGLELISTCGRIYASPEARVGVPQLDQGLIAPVASLTLPERIGLPAATELCASGHIKRADEASWIGLVDHVVEAPEQVARGEIEEYLAPLSASSVRLSIRALNTGLRDRFRAGIEAVRRLYLEELMGTADAREGVRALAEDRKPVWRHE